MWHVAWFHQGSAVRNAAAGMAPSSPATTIAETAGIATTVATIPIAGTRIAATMVKETSGIGAGRVLRWAPLHAFCGYLRFWHTNSRPVPCNSEGGNVAAAMGPMTVITPMEITPNTITEAIRPMRKRARPSCSEVCPWTPQRPMWVCILLPNLLHV